MKIVGIFFSSYIVFCLGLESDEDEYRRFIPVYPYSEKMAINNNGPEDPSLIPMKAPKELVLEVAKRSKLLQQNRTPINLDQAEQRKLRASGQYWDRVWTEPLKEGRRIDSEASSLWQKPYRKNGVPAGRSVNQAPTSSSTKSYEPEILPVVPDVPQSIADTLPKTDQQKPSPSYVPSFSMVNFGKNEPDDIKVKTEKGAEQPAIVTVTPAQPTKEIIVDLDLEKKSTTAAATIEPTTIKPFKNDKEDKSKKQDGKLVISLPGAEVQGLVKAKLVPGTKLYKLMKNAQKTLGENYQPKLLYLVNNY